MNAKEGDLRGCLVVCAEVREPHQFSSHCINARLVDDSPAVPPTAAPDVKANERTVLEATPASAPISYSDGKKIYDQGWNDGIEHLKKLLMLAAEQRFGR